jgi:hypothetical protein
LAASFERLRADGSERGQLARDVEELIERLPPELRDGPDGLLLDGELAVSELVDAAERLLLSRLSGALGEESSR